MPQKSECYDNHCCPLFFSVQVLFLERRENSLSTATLMTTGSKGSVRAWSVCGGGLLGYFAATQGVHESVISMTTDHDNTVLVTGDTAGFVKVRKLLIEVIFLDALKVK